MKKIIPSLILISFLFNVNSIANGLDAIRNAEMEYNNAKQAQEKRQMEIQAKKEMERRAIAAKKEQERKAQLAAKAEVERIEKERAYNEYMSDKKREQSFEDELRRLELEERKSALEERKAMRAARSKRADDFAIEDLNRIKADTDVIQSQADVDRSIAKGTQTLMEKEGDARIKANSGLFK